MAEPATIANDEPTEPRPPTQEANGTIGIPHEQAVEPHTDARMDTTPSPDPETEAEPNIWAILEED